MHSGCRSGLRVFTNTLQPQSAIQASNHCPFSLGARRTLAGGVGVALAALAGFGEGPGGKAERVRVQEIEMEGETVGKGERGRAGCTKRGRWGARMSSRGLEWSDTDRFSPRCDHCTAKSVTFISPPSATQWHPPTSPPTTLHTHSHPPWQASRPHLHPAARVRERAQMQGRVSTENERTDPFPPTRPHEDHTK